jgi:hypothetical protein
MPVLVARATNARLGEIIRPMVRPVVVAVFVLVSAGVVGHVVEPPATWVSVVVVAAISALAGGGAYALLAASRDERRDVVTRLLMVAGRTPRAAVATVPDPSVNEFQTWMTEARSA